MEAVEAAVLTHLQTMLPQVNTAWASEGHPVTELPRTWDTGPPPLTTAEGYPAVYVIGRTLVDSHPFETTGVIRNLYRLDVATFTRAQTRAEVHAASLRLAAAVTVALQLNPRVAADMTVDVASFTADHSTVEAVPNGGMLKGVITRFDVDTLERLPTLPPPGTANTFDVTGDPL
jgi:hypothetical protein